ncbi:uncharacterized protein LOC122147184 isoform X1 [Cyprinus carpio]|uniref:Uncharacterized protein LOC122147184 isoform X1 n=1 Tax=Cyprinus carpio TaxID=7962 RepID=A0A9R0B712_CYPCA|nr:uncharacterized protein LOC122147184 isoform X1 [Cyprinus carpio]
MKAWFVLILLLPLCMGGHGDSFEVHADPGVCMFSPCWRGVPPGALVSPTIHRHEADHYIECYGEDFLMVRNMVLQCRSKVTQACYTRATGEKGCVSVEFCQRKGWTCCYENLCNA